MKINVLINGGNRPKDLERLLQSLMAQIRRPDSLCILIHPRDTESGKLIETLVGSAISWTLVYKDHSGPMAAMQKALQMMTCDVVAFTHDDAAPRVDWLEKVASTLISKPECAGVGGRDLPVSAFSQNLPPVQIVGKVTWYGKIITQYHLPCIGGRNVDFLSGVNMAYRHDILRTTGLNQCLQWQQDTCWHWELALGMALKEQGWKQWYDPEMVVEHYPGKLFSEQKDSYWSAAARKRAFNETYILMKYLSIFGRFFCMFYALLIGSRDSYGFVQCFRHWPQEGNLALRKWMDTMRGRYAGMATWLYPGSCQGLQE
ncbi:glycosyltransferase [Acidithiobacillus montserratensis]|uniref:Glycosyltransferase n=1 Tax=Acidithiobacillus montserratensis TaxID=2729135 RepID=A0ACD5HHC1_9PROT|nr:glycosyltransferase family 2 protein [Acidithiobacillus montserratensis]MBU2746747.1 glycosyltransferase [Acidithiobacillus montserratensis]